MDSLLHSDVHLKTLPAPSLTYAAEREQGSDGRVQQMIYSSLPGRLGDFPDRITQDQQDDDPPSTRLGMPIPNEKSMLVGITMVIAKKLNAWLLSACR